MNTVKEKIIVIEKEQQDVVVQADEAVTVVICLDDTSKTKTMVCRVRLVGKGAHADILGFIIGKGENNLSLETHQLHESPQTTSNLLVRSVLFDTARFSYSGAIRVEKEAQKTDAYQRNENLLISPGAHAESKPALEILANDVRCTHGATVSPLSADHLWYLQTRGIAPAVGKNLLIDGFLAGSLSQLSDTMIGKSIQTRIRSVLYG